MKKMLYVQALTLGMKEALASDERVILMGEDVGKMGACYGQTLGLYDEFGPKRVIDTPISESGIVGAAVGLGMMGKRPIVELMFGDFSGLAFDSITNQLAKMRYMSGGQWTLPVVVRACHGAGVGAGAQHSQTIESWFSGVPGLKIVVPSTAQDAYSLIKAAVKDENPVLYLEHKHLFTRKGEVDTTIEAEIGKAKITREGSDLTIVTYQLMHEYSLQAAKQLEEEGISVEVVDVRSIRPLDIDTISASVKKTGKALVVHEAPQFGGFGGEIASMISERNFKHLKAPVMRLGGADVPIPFNEAEFFCFPSVDEIISASKNLLEKNK